MEELITASVVDFALAIFVGFVVWLVTSRIWKVRLAKKERLKLNKISELEKKAEKLKHQSIANIVAAEWDLAFNLFSPSRQQSGNKPTASQMRLVIELIDYKLINYQDLTLRFKSPGFWSRDDVSRILKEHSADVEALKKIKAMDAELERMMSGKSSSSSAVKEKEGAPRLDLAHLPGIKKFPYTANYSILTIPERRFYHCLCRWADGHGFAIAPKVRMQDLLSLKKGLKRDDYLAWFWEINQRHVDFTVLDTQKNYRRTLFCIELDGDSHLTEKQKQIDAFKNRALASAGLMLFRHNMPKGKPSNEVFFNLEQLRKELDQDLAKAASAQKQGGKR